MKLLHIQSSPRGTRSHSLATAQAFIDAYREAHPGHAVETLDVWAADLPPFDGAALRAKYAVMGGSPHDTEEAQAWAGVRRIIEHFKSFDRIVISVPMWNFGVPYRLKHYIDLIAQPGETFGWSAERGYFGLVEGHKAVIVHSSAGDYRPGSGAEAIDFQRPYLEFVLKFFGFASVETLAVAPTAADPAVVDAAVTESLARARELARRF
jgi:FMN-dependent NADH-azoreductase